MTKTRSEIDLNLYIRGKKDGKKIIPETKKEKEKRAAKKNLLLRM